MENAGVPARPMLYRGTSSGWPGNPVLQELRITPTTTNPLVAVLFGIECQRFGRGIVIACDRRDVEKLIGPSNVLSSLESEVVIDVPPTVFAERFGNWIIDVGVARQILTDMGIETPQLIRDKEQLQQELQRLGVMTPEQIAAFNERLVAGAAL